MKVFDFLGVDSKDFDFDRSKSLGVTGSSDLKRKEGVVHWRVMEKSENFNPLNRFSNWNKAKHERFNWIAGPSMTGFGYKLEETGSEGFLYIFKNRLFDFLRKPKKPIKTTSS